MSAIPKPTTIFTVATPRLSVRTAASFLRLPAVEQMRILHDQKYPKQVPQVFRQPYYQPALTSIRHVLENGASGLVTARAELQRVTQPSRRMHSMRVLEQFIGSEHAKRLLQPTVHKRFYANVNGLELRLSPDLFAFEGDEERFIYFNFKAEQYNPESAKMTIEIAHWLLEQNKLEVMPEQIEFIDLFTGTLYRVKKRRAKTLKLLEENAKLIRSLWPTIDP
jgi:hypothetical protein